MLEAIQDNRKSLSEQVADRLLQLILDRNLAVGEKLPNEFEIAQQLQVGRGTVREAVRLLISRQVLEIRRGKGTYVCQNPGLARDPLGFAFSRDKLKLTSDLIELRAILEPPIAALAARRATQEDVAQMWRVCLLAEQQLAADENHIHNDMEFHVLIARSTRNEVMPNLIPIIHTGIELYNSFPPDEQKLEALYVHRDILKAIEEKNPEKARAAMELHLSYNLKYMQRVEEEYARNPKN